VIVVVTDDFDDDDDDSPLLWFDPRLVPVVPEYPRRNVFIPAVVTGLPTGGDFPLPLLCWY